jgi:hypothetical protein
MGISPQLVGEINFIVSYFFNGCRTPLMLYCETALPIAGDAAWALLDFGWDDVMRSFFRPKGLRSGRHGRKRRGRKGVPGIPEISDLVAERIALTKELQKRRVSDGVKHLWIFDGWLQRAIYEVFLVEIAEDFLFKSILAALKLKATHCEIPGRAMQHCDSFYFLTNGQFYSVHFNIIDYVEYPAYADGYTIAGFGADKWQVYAGVQVYVEGTVIGNVTVQWHVTTGEGIFTFEKDFGNVGPGFSGGSVLSGSWTGPVNVDCVIRAGCSAHVTFGQMNIIKAAF